MWSYKLPPPLHSVAGWPGTNFTSLHFTGYWHLLCNKTNRCKYQRGITGNIDFISTIGCSLCVWAVVPSRYGYTSHRRTVFASVTLPVTAFCANEACSATLTKTSPKKILGTFIITSISDYKIILLIGTCMALPPNENVLKLPHKYSHFLFRKFLFKDF